MKKFFAVLTAAAASFALSSSASAFASGEEYNVGFRFKADSAAGITQISENTIRLDPGLVRNDGFSLDLNVYIEDELQQLYSLYVFWKCDSEYVSLGNLVNPKTDDISDAPVTYSTSLGEFFSTTKMPFCYAEINDEADLSVNNTIYTAAAPQIGENTLGLSYVNTNTRPSSFSTLGASSDEFPYASFTADFASDTPEGVYEIYFLDKNNPDTVNKFNYTKAAYCDDTGLSFASAKTNLNSLTIIIGDPVELGEMNGDGIITAVDAATVLSAYAKSATVDDTGLSPEQTIAADVNADGLITAADAALILSYYSYISTNENPVSFRDYLAQQN